MTGCAYDIVETEDFLIPEAVDPQDPITRSLGQKCYNYTPVSVDDIKNGGVGDPGYREDAAYGVYLSLDNTTLPMPSYYQYDHLGNTRVVFTPYQDEFGNYECLLGQGDIAKLEIETLLDYYPYGKVLREFHIDGNERYMTTQHERDQETQLDYRGARFYDGDVGRFLSLDPLAVDYPSLSDYVYVANNPIIFVDPDGKKIKPTNERAKAAVDALATKYSTLLKVSYSNGVYGTSSAITDMSTLRQEAKAIGMKLNRSERTEALSFLQGLNGSTKELSIIEPFTSSGSDFTGGDSTGGSSSGSRIQEGDLVTNNSEYNEWVDINKDQSGQRVDQASMNLLFTQGSQVTIDGNTYSINPTSRTQGAVYFQNEDPSIRGNEVRGHIVVDGTNQTSEQDINSILNALILF